MRTRTSLSISIPILALVPPVPGLDSPPATTLAKPGELIVATNFDTDAPRTRKGKIAGWNAGIGEWWIADGALHGDELEADQHASSCTFRLEASDLVLRAQFRLGEAQQLAIGFRDTIAPNHHLARVFVDRESVWIQRMEGIAKTTKATKLAESREPLDPDSWHDLTVEIVGDRYRATIDGRVLEARHDRFRDAKGIVALISKGRGAQFRKVAIWHAQSKAP